MLEQILAHAGRPRRLLADLYESIAHEHLARPNVSCRSARKERPLSLTPKKALQGYVAGVPK